MLKRRWRCACGFDALVPVQMLGETVACPKCAAQAAISMQNSAPLLPEAASGGTPGACGRCGRKFRGEWDQHRRDELTICDICARQADGSDHGGGAAHPGPPATGEFITREEWEAIHQASPQLVGDAAGWRAPLKLLAAMAGTAMLVTAVLAYLVYFAPGTVDAYRDGQAPGLAAFLARCFVTGFLVNVAALYALCWYLERLPNDDWRANLAVFSAIGLLLAVIGLAGVNPLLSGGSFILSVLIVQRLYDLNLVEMVLFALVKGFFAAVLMIVGSLIAYSAAGR